MKLGGCSQTQLLHILMKSTDRDTSGVQSTKQPTASPRASGEGHCALHMAPSPHSRDGPHSHLGVSDTLSAPSTHCHLSTGSAPGHGLHRARLQDPTFCCLHPI